MTIVVGSVDSVVGAKVVIGMVVMVGVVVARVETGTSVDGMA